MDRWNAEFLEPDELRRIGFGALGRGVLIHRTAVLVNCGSIHIGDRVRIDPFVVLSAGEGIRIGGHVHIASHVSITGAALIDIQDFAGISQGARLLSASDDFSGESLTGPTLPAGYTNVHSAPIVVGRHALVGAGSVLLPGCGIGEGSAVGALSLVNRPLDAWTIYAGAPARALRARSRNLLALEAELRRSEGEPGPSAPPQA